MIDRTFVLTLPPMKRVPLSVVVYNNYQYFHYVASRFIGGKQSNLIVFGIN